MFVNLYASMNYKNKERNKYITARRLYDRNSNQKELCQSVYG